MSGWQVTITFTENFNTVLPQSRGHFRVCRALDKCLIGRGTNNAGYTLNSVRVLQATKPHQLHTTRPPDSN